jgi:hypothetical protein
MGGKYIRNKIEAVPKWCRRSALARTGVLDFEFSLKSEIGGYAEQRMSRPNKTVSISGA